MSVTSSVDGTQRATTDRPSVLLLGDRAIGIRRPFVHELHRLGVRITVAKPHETEFDAELTDVDVVSYPMDARHPVRAARAVKALRIETGSQIVHAFSTLPATIASLSSCIDGRGRYVRTVNGLGRSFSTTGALGSVMRVCYTASMITLDRRVVCEVFQNHDDLRWFGETPVLRHRRREVILGSGADLSRFSVEAVSSERADAARTFLGSNGRPTAVLIARHLRSKGVDDLADMARRMGDLTDRPMLLAVVGPPGGVSRDAARSTDGVHGTVEFKRLGSWSDMPALYAASDVVVLPTVYREGIPRVLLEGAAMQRPLVAYDVPGCREIVVSGSNGHLVPPGDLDAMTAHVMRLLTDADERSERGAAGRQLVTDRFDVGHIARRYAQLYRDIVAP